MRIVVVGGGIAGLSAAWFLRDAGDVTVLEATSQVGGKLGSAQVAGLTVESGAESVLARRPEAVELIRAVGLGDDLIHPETSAAGMWSRGHVRPLPAEQVMGVPSDLAALARSGIVSTAAIARALGDTTTPVVPRSEDVSVAAHVGERLGAEIVERLVDPLLGGVYAGRAEELSMFATMPQFTEAVRAGVPLTTAAAEIRAQAPTGPVFAGISGGLGRLPGAVAAASGARVRTGVTVQTLSRTLNGWAVGIRSAAAAGTLADELIEADAVVVAAPAPAAARLLATEVPVAAAELEQIPYASLAVVTLVYPPAAGRPPAGGSGFLVPAVDRRLIKAATFSSVKWAWTAAGASAAGCGTVLRASVGRFGDEAELQRSDEDLVHGVAVDVAHATGLDASPVDWLVNRWGGSLPQYLVGHLDRVRRIRAAVAAVPGLAVCGAAYDGVGIAATVGSARLAAERIVGSAGPRGTMEA